MSKLAKKILKSLVHYNIPFSLFCVEALFCYARLKSARGGSTSKDGTSQKHVVVVGTYYVLYVLGGKPGTTKKKQVAT